MANERAERAERESEYFAAMMQAIAECVRTSIARSMLVGAADRHSTDANLIGDHAILVSPKPEHLALNKDAEKAIKTCGLDFV
jgi:hypothetical protein